jgi:hypothetical protein
LCRWKDLVNIKFQLPYRKSNTRPTGLLHSVSSNNATEALMATVFIRNSTLPRASWFAWSTYTFLSSFRTWTWFLRFNTFKITHIKFSFYDVNWRVKVNSHVTFRVGQRAMMLTIMYISVVFQNSKMVTLLHMQVTLKKLHISHRYLQFQNALLLTSRPGSVQISRTRSSEMSKDFHQSTRRCISEDGALQVLKV